MTNSEKSMLIAREVANKCIKGKFDNCLESAMKMAEWKDEQFKKLLDSVNPSAFASAEEMLNFVKNNIKEI